MMIAKQHKRSRQPDRNLVVKLYEPVMSTQALLYDVANCVAVETLLNIQKVPFEVIEKTNVQFICSVSSGYVPSIRFGKLIFNDCQSIIYFFSDKIDEITEGNNSTNSIYRSMVHNNYCDFVLPSTSSISKEVVNLDAIVNFNKCCKPRLNKEIYVENVIFSLIQTFEHIEKYICWIDKETFDNETYHRYRSVYPWPLDYFMTRMELSNIKQFLQDKGLYDRKNIMKGDLIFKEGVKILKIFSIYLGDSTFFIGDKPKGIDCLLYGHLNAVLNYQNRNDLLILQELAKYIMSDDVLLTFLQSFRKYLT